MHNEPWNRKPNENADAFRQRHAPARSTSGSSLLSHSDLSSLRQALDQEIALLQRLLPLMHREKAVLIETDSEHLRELADEKNHICKAIQTCHEERLVRCFSGSAPEAVLGDYPDLLDKWHKVLNLAKSARDLNAFNGGLLAEFMKRNQAALTALVTSANNVPVYEESGAGSRGSIGKGRTLWSA